MHETSHISEKSDELNQHGDYGREKRAFSFIHTILILSLTSIRIYSMESLHFL